MLTLFDQRLICSAFPEAALVHAETAAEGILGPAVQVPEVPGVCGGQGSHAGTCPGLQKTQPEGERPG